MSDRTYSQMVDDLDWDFFVGLVVSTEGGLESLGPDYFGMYCMGNEL